MEQPEVKITKSWSLKAFAKEFGTPRFASCLNKETGEKFNTLAFVKEGQVTFCHFGYSTEGYSIKDIQENKDSLEVGLNSNGNYSLYKRSAEAWDIVDLD